MVRDLLVQIYLIFSQKKYKVTIIDDLSTGNKRNIKNKKINFIYSNINNINKLKKIGNFDVIVHLAAMAEILITKKDEKKYFESNIEGLQQVLNFASQKKIKKFIFASSASIYGDTKNIKVKENFNANPKHYYAYTKYIGEKMIEKYCKNNEIKFSILRFFNVYGPNSTVMLQDLFLSIYKINQLPSMEMVCKKEILFTWKI